MRGVFVIVIVGCLSLVVELKKILFFSKEELFKFIEEKLNYFVILWLIVVNMGKVVKKFI